MAVAASGVNKRKKNETCCANKPVLVLFFLFSFTWRIEALDCVCCDRQQLLGSWITPLAPPRAKSSRRRRHAPPRPARLMAGRESLSGNRGDEEGVWALIHVEGFLVNQAANRANLQKRRLTLWYQSETQRNVQVRYNVSVDFVDLFLILPFRTIINAEI